MGFVFVLIGVVLGSFSGHFMGAVFGGAVGYVVHQLRRGQKRSVAAAEFSGAVPAEPEARPLPQAPAPASAYGQQLVESLTQRVQALERQVSSLQRTVDQLSQTGVANAAAVAVQQDAAAQASPAPIMAVASPATAAWPLTPPTVLADAPLELGNSQAVSDSELTAQALAAADCLPASNSEGTAPLTEAEALPAQPAIHTNEALSLAAGTESKADTASAPGEPSSAVTPEPVPAGSPPSSVDPAILADNWPDDDIVQPVGKRPREAWPHDTELAPPRDFKDYVPERLRPLIFGGNTIVKVGVLILFLGLSFLLKYVAEQVTVPIEMRYASVALLGAGLLGLGWRLRDKTDASGATGYGLILQGAGVGVFYLTTLAAMKLHPLLPVPVGFGLMALVTAFAALLAVAQNAPWLAMVASAAGFATPLLVSTGHANHLALFSYLAILDMGIVAMAWFRAWRPLNLIGFTGTFALAAGWAAQHYTAADYASVQAFLLLFFLMFTAIGVLFARRALALGDDADTQASLGTRAAQALRQLGRVDSTLVFGVPLATYGLQYQMVRDDPWLPALSALVMGLFYVVMGAALWRGKVARYALLAEAYVVVGVLFGTLSVPLALETRWTGATWAIEAAGMYWLGTRQHRSYTRAFAMALLGLAAVNTLSALGWSAEPLKPFLSGSVLGMLMLAGSALAVALVHRRAQQGAAPEAMPTPSGLVTEQVGQWPPSAPPSHAASYAGGANWEAAGATGAWWLSVASLAALPWMLLMPIWASVAMAFMAVGALLLAERTRLPALTACSPVLHLLALGGFASTLHQRDGQAMLANGLTGLSAAVLIGASMLASAWLGLRETWRRATGPQAAEGPPPSWPVASSLGLVAGLGLISGALLFLMPMEHAALVWPVLGLLMLWVSLKLAHPALSFMWAALTAASALAFMVFGPSPWPVLDVLPPPGAQTLAWHGPAGGLAWWTPLLLTACTTLAAAWLHAAATRTQGWRMPWVSANWVQVGMVGATLWWWAQTLPPEIVRYLQTSRHTEWLPASLALWVTLSSALLVALGRWRQWPLMGQTAVLTIPMWVSALTFGPMSEGHPPFDALGWLAWPVALAWHPVLLRQSARWWSRLPQSWMHVSGFWLFALIATRQMQWASDEWTEPGSAWQALGWLLVPLALTVTVSLPAWRTRWPLSEFGKAYRQVGAAPLVVALVGWLLWSAFNAGDAAPLPYVPALNPLEIGQGLVMLTLLMWARALPDNDGSVAPPREWRIGTLGSLGFVLLTTMVLRACHHWAGVPWEGSALFASKLTQAALSVTWAVVGVGLMLRGHRHVQRKVWGLGAALLGVVVLKLFFVELADHGSLYRIVSFIVVGLLLLVVGYFAPVPPGDSAPTPTPDQEAA
jgi:uncharacterized membrane protein